MSALPNTVVIAADNARLVNLLRESQERLLATVAGVDDAQSRFQPAEGRWSVLGCVEHVAGAEMFMFRLLQGPRRPRPAGVPNREEKFFSSVADRSRKVDSPERGHPKGRFANLGEACRQFEIARAETIRFLDSNTEDLRATEITHPLFGDVSAVELLIIMAKHVERHALQIEEIKNSPAFLANMERRS